MSDGDVRRRGEDGARREAAEGVRDGGVADDELAAAGTGRGLRHTGETGEDVCSFGMCSCRAWIAAHGCDALLQPSCRFSGPHMNRDRWRHVMRVPAHAARARGCEPARVLGTTLRSRAARRAHASCGRQPASAVTDSNRFISGPLALSVALL